MTEKKDDGITVTIFKEIPGAPVNKTLPVKLKKGDESDDKNVLRKLTKQKQKAKQDEEHQTDSSGEDG